MSDIRVTYTGFISFFVSIIIVIAGSLVTLILTRTLSQEEFGTWGLIAGITQYVLVFSAIITFWSTRDIARKIESGKTAILGQMIFSIIAVILYIFVSYFLGNKVNLDLDILFFSVILIPMMFLSGVLTAITLGWKPHVISYGLVSFGISQIIFAFIFVYYYDLGVYGIILANFISYGVNIIILLKFSKNKITNELNFNFFKKWLKLSWIPLYPWLAIIFSALEISIFTLMTGSVMGLAIWTASIAISSIVIHVSTISKAVYPKLLGDKNVHYLRENISLLFFFNFLVVGIIIALAKPALYALNPIYVNAFLVVIILAISHFFLVLSTVSTQSLAGSENIDLNGKTTLKNYLRSKLFYPHTIRFVESLFFIPILIVGLYFLINSEHSDIDLLVFWSLIILIIHIPVSIYLTFKMTKALCFKLDYKRILKYFIIGLFSFTTIFIISENYLVFEKNLFTFLPNLLLLFTLGILFYLSLCYVFDKKIRLLVTSILKEIKSK
jgi:O-antigen/teichoic acid export membrane protein|tara:strand:- start:373 stop:1866 length:1494 start_codon:yes stop_codon:yes gene_type:complete